MVLEDHNTSRSRRVRVGDGLFSGHDFGFGYDQEVCDHGGEVDDGRTNKTAQPLAWRRRARRSF